MGGLKLMDGGTKVCGKTGVKASEEELSIEMDGSQFSEDE